MPEMRACCGLVCSTCPTYLATQNDDDAARAATAALYSKKFGFSLRPADINCDGCLSLGGRLIGYCSACTIRKCCKAKGLENCAACRNHPCAVLETFHASSPEAKSAFRELMKQQRQKKDEAT